MPVSPSLASWSSIGWVSNVILLYGLMVVAGPRILGWRTGTAAGGGRCARPGVELVVEDRAHRAIGQRADLGGARGRRFHTVDAERPHQARIDALLSYFGCLARRVRSAPWHISQNRLTVNWPRFAMLLSG
jgi:hypothetical protein